jgi:hypothetical protein
MAEAATAFRNIIESEFRLDFTLIGGYALFLHGHNRKTRDLDFLVTPESLEHWETAAVADPRFKKGCDAQWVYHCTGDGIESLTVPLEFVTLENISGIRDVRTRGGITVRELHVASIPILAILKAEAVAGRGFLSDAQDLLWALKVMFERGLGFDGIELREGETLRDVLHEAGELAEGLLASSDLGDLQELIVYFSYGSI